MCTDASLSHTHASVSVYVTSVPLFFLVSDNKTRALSFSYKICSVN